MYQSYRIIAYRLTHECHARSPGVRDIWPSSFDILIPAFESVQTSSRHLTIDSKPARGCVQKFFSSNRLPLNRPIRTQKSSLLIGQLKATLPHG
ncbi:hypothetical protein ACS0PU_002125 [Formica fusca]